jgi:glycosyltransferase involved in cell wall biosynthesis
MNIAIVNEFFPPKITGGTEIFLEELAKYLKFQGHKVVMITTDQNQGVNKKFKVYKIRSSPFHFGHRYQFHGVTTPWMFFNSCLRKKISEIYRNEKIDLLYINNMFHLSFTPIQTEIPFILDVHDYWPICFSKDLYYRNKEFCSEQTDPKCSYCLSKKARYPLFFSIPMFGLERYFRKKLLGSAKKTVCHSQFVSKILKNYDYENEIIPYPYLGPNEKPKIRKDGVFKILFVGRIEKRKGAHLLLDIAKNLRDKIDFRIDVIGEGPLKKTLDRKDLNIYVHGFLGKERFGFFKEADCLLAPSLWPEPFGMVALEAMACDVPVITLNESGGLADLVKENEIGIVTNKGNIAESIIRLYRDQVLQKSIKMNCKMNIEKYDKEKIFKRYEKLFTSVIR